MATLLGSTTASVPIVRGAVSAVRIFPDMKDLKTDARVAELMPSENHHAQLVETASRAVGHQATFARGIAELLKGRIGSRLLPGAKAAMLAADSSVAVNVLRNSSSSVEEKVAASLTAVASAVAATPTPLLSSLAGIASAALSLWRDDENDQGRRSAQKEALQERARISAKRARTETGDVGAD